MAIKFLNTVQVDTDVLYVDTTNDRVGIGTTSPDALLDLGVNNIITLDDTGSSTGFIGMGSYNDGTKNRAQGASYYGFGLEIDRPNQLISFNSYDSNGATGGGTDILVLKVDGKVGIGTDSPDTTLHVAGPSTLATQGTVLKIENTADQGSSQDIHIYNQYDRDIGIKFETLGGTNYIWQDSNGDDALIISTGGSNRTNNAALILEQDQDVLIPNGNLGIGTDNPTRQLEVVSSDGIVTVLTSTTGGSYISMEDSTTTSDSQVRFGAIGNNAVIKSGGVTALSLNTSQNATFAGNINIKDALLSNQVNTDIDTGAEVVAQVAIATYTAAFFDFVVKKGTNVRSGTVYACFDGTNVEFTETSTNDLGDTSDVVLSVDKTSTNLRLLATVGSDDWSVKSLIRAI